MTVATNRYQSAGLNGFTASPRRGLTPADLAYISALRAKNRSWQTIATIMGRARADIEAAATVEAHTQARAKVFDWTPERLDTARAFYRTHSNPEMLAVEVGCSIDEASAQLGLQRRMAKERQREADRARQQARRPTPKPRPVKSKPASEAGRPVTPPVLSWATTLQTAPHGHQDACATPAPLEVAKIAAEVYGLSLEAICRPAADRKRVRGRWIAAWAIRKYCSLNGGPPSYPEIGRVLGNFHHTTIMYGVCQLEKLIARGHFHDVLNRLAERIAKPVLDSRVEDARLAFSAARTERAQVLADAV
jgi:hypothetical protein